MGWAEIVEGSEGWRMAQGKIVIHIHKENGKERIQSTGCCTSVFIVDVENGFIKIKIYQLFTEI